MFAIKRKTLTLKRVHNVDDKSDKSSLCKTLHNAITTNIYFFIILNILSMRELRLFRIFPITELSDRKCFRFFQLYFAQNPAQFIYLYITL